MPLGAMVHRRSMSTLDTAPLEPPTTGRAAHGFVGSVLAMAVLVSTVTVALLTEVGQRFDERAMNTVTAAREAQLSLLSGLGRAPMFALLTVAVVCVAIALLRGRLRLAVAAMAVFGGANVTTQVLKHGFLDRPDFGFGTLNSLPSGHTTVVAGAVAALALVAPRALLPVVAAGGAFAATLTGASTIVAGWHRPSDVVVALAVTAAWAGLVALMIGGRVELPRGTFAAAVVGAGSALVVLVAIGVRPLFGWGGFMDASLVLGAVALATAGFAWLVTRLGG